MDTTKRNHYLLLTPGPLTTSAAVKEVMLKDWCTWDNDYNNIVQDIRKRLVELATPEIDKFTSVLMQGSGTFSVESVIGSVIPPHGKLLVLVNGAYGHRVALIAKCLGIDNSVLDFTELHVPDLGTIEEKLKKDNGITHVVVVHCETTTGMLNPIHDIAKTVKKYNKVFIVDAMSSFGGIPIDMSEIDIDFLVSSANKCIQGVPGFGFTIAKRCLMERVEGYARSLSLDLFDQWRTMENENGKWRFTSATHTVRAFAKALDELEIEGGVVARYKRYLTNQQMLVDGMKKLGFKTLLPETLHSPIITTFISPKGSWYDFNSFYGELKKLGFVIYPGKVTNYNCFRIGNIGEIYPNDIKYLLQATATVVEKLKCKHGQL